MSNIKDGKLHGIAAASTRRSPSVPDVPTNIEAGVPDLESDTLTGIVAPAGTPREIIERWHSAIVQMVCDARYRAEAGDLGLCSGREYAAEFGQRLKSEMAKWGKVVHDAGIRAD